MSAAVSRRPARSRQALLAGVCLTQAMAIIGFDFTLPFIPLYLQHDLGVHGLGPTAIWAGLIGFGPAIPATVFAPVWGRLADRFGYRAMLLRATLSAAVILSLMGFAPNPEILLALRLLQGVLTGTVFAAQALVATSVPEAETGRAMGLLQMSVYMGATIGPVAGGVVAGTMGFRATYVAAGIMIGLATLVILVFVHEPPHAVSRRREHAKIGASRPSTMSLLTVPAFAMALVLTLSVQLAGTSLLPIIPLAVQQLLDSARDVPQYTGWLMAVTGLAGGAGSYVSGRLYRSFGLKLLIPIFLALSGALLFSQAFAGSYPAFLMLRGAGSFTYGGLLGLVSTMAALSSPRDAKGAAFGLMGGASSLGFGGGPLLGGLIVAACGIHVVFLIAAAMLILIPPALGGLVMSLPAVSRWTGRLLPARD